MSAEIIFIGTSSAITEQDRFHSSFIIKINNYHLLVDAGDGVSKALLTAGIPFGSIDGVIFSHRHADHWSGMPSLVTQWKLDRKTSPVSIFAHRSDIGQIKRYLHDSYLFENRMQFPLEYISFTEDISFSPAEGLAVSAFTNTHLDKYKTDFNQNGEFFSGSFRFTVGQKKVYYTGDLGSEEDLLLCKERPDILITECSHVSNEAIRELAHKFEKTNIIMTHYSNNQAPELVSLIDNNTGNNIYLAQEGMRVKLADNTVTKKENLYYA